MDVNGLSYFLLREADEFEFDSTRLHWHSQHKALTLAQNQELRLPTTGKAASLARLATAKPLVFDRYGQVCRIHESGIYLEYNAGRGYLPLKDDELNIVNSVVGSFTDLAINYEGRLAAGYSSGTEHGLLVFHLAKRWQAAVALPEAPQRVLVEESGIDDTNTIWVLTANYLLRCQGEPLPHTYLPQMDRFEPLSINPHPLQIVDQFALRAADLALNEQHLALITDQEQALSLCADKQNLYLLTSGSGTSQAIISLPLSGNRKNKKRYLLERAIPFVVDMGWVSQGRLALMPVQEIADTDFIKRDCPVVELKWTKADDEDGEAAVLLIRERHPMLSQAEPRFVASADKILRYQAKVIAESEEGAQLFGELGFDRRPRELHALQRPRYYTIRSARDEDPIPIAELDSGLPNQIWHRVYLEGRIPAGTRLRLFVKTYNSEQEKDSANYIEQPDWVWCPFRSDQAFGKGLVDEKEHESGLFENLLQRRTGPVRRIVGRYLQIALVFESDGRHTPSVHALKIYYARFSYQETYLPEHFRQEHNVNPELDHLPANGADVRERLLAAVEASWTPLETQIANSELLLHPQFTLPQYLPQLATSLGQMLPAHWSVTRQRRWLLETGKLQQYRGTLYGVQLALDILTEGAVARGQVVLVENFRLRRTMATILGVSMDDEEHPLTLGTGVSGNSIVGDSLILADEEQRDFISLFAPGLATTTEKKIVANFFDRYANQVTVLLHGDARRFKDVVETMLQQEMPAHLQWRLVETNYPFVLGLAPLLGVDTYLEHQPSARPVILDDTWLGYEGLLKNPPAFSPRDVHSRTN
jgi:Phage tail protein (Tail_P2_I)